MPNRDWKKEDAMRTRGLLYVVVVTLCIGAGWALAGLTQNHPVERLMSNAKLIQILEGTNQI